MAQGILSLVRFLRPRQKPNVREVTFFVAISTAAKEVGRILRSGGNTTMWFAKARRQLHGSFPGMCT